MPGEGNPNLAGQQGRTPWVLKVSPHVKIQVFRGVLGCPWLSSLVLRARDMYCTRVHVIKRPHAYIYVISCRSCRTCGASTLTHAQSLASEPFHACDIFPGNPFSGSTYICTCTYANGQVAACFWPVYQIERKTFPGLGIIRKNLPPLPCRVFRHDSYSAHGMVTQSHS